MLCEILTDNRNRTAGEVRKIFELAGGKLGATGCVAWMFDRKGLITIPADQVDEDALMELALEAGAEDVRREGDNFDIICDPDAFTSVPTRSIKPVSRPRSGRSRVFRRTRSIWTPRRPVAS